MPDLLAYWLTGERHAEATNASTTQLLDARTGEWAHELIRAARPATRGSSRRSSSRDRSLGGLLPHVADATGLPRSTPVVGGRLARHRLGRRRRRRSRGRAPAYISSGTWSLVGVELDEPVSARSARVRRTSRTSAASAARSGCSRTSWVSGSCRSAAAPGCAKATRLSYAELAAARAAAAPGGALFDPDLPELLAPGDMPARIRAACVRAGQAAPAERAVRCCARSSRASPASTGSCSTRSRR